MRLWLGRHAGDRPKAKTSRALLPYHSFCSRVRATTTHRFAWTARRRRLGRAVEQRRLDRHGCEPERAQDKTRTDQVAAAGSRSRRSASRRSRTRRRSGSRRRCSTAPRTGTARSSSAARTAWTTARITARPTVARTTTRPTGARTTTRPPRSPTAGRLAVEQRRVESVGAERQPDQAGRRAAPGRPRQRVWAATPRSASRRSARKRRTSRAHSPVRWPSRPSDATSAAARPVVTRARPWASAATAPAARSSSRTRRTRRRRHRT